VSSSKTFEAKLLMTLLGAVPNEGDPESPRGIVARVTQRMHEALHSEAGQAIARQRREGKIDHAGYRAGIAAIMRAQREEQEGAAGGEE
jgi:hypothetical protein